MRHKRYRGWTDAKAENAKLNLHVSRPHLPLRRSRLQGGGPLRLHLTNTHG